MACRINVSVRAINAQLGGDADYSGSLQDDEDTMSVHASDSPAYIVQAGVVVKRAGPESTEGTAATICRAAHSGSPHAVIQVYAMKLFVAERASQCRVCRSRPGGHRLSHALPTRPEQRQQAL